VKYQVFFLNITTHCNQHCPFCFMGFTAAPAHKSLEQVARELAKARELCDGRDIVMSGGEPTVHPQILDILEAAGSFGFSRVTLFTNGQRLHNKELVAALVRGGLRAALIPLHGSSPEMHDSLVGRPHFRQVLQGLEQSLAAGVDVIINTVATTANLEDIPAINHLVQDRFAGASSYRLTYPAVMGEMRRRPDLLPTYDQVTSLISSLLDRTPRVPLSSDLVPLCLLGSNRQVAVEYHFSRDAELSFDDSQGINRIGGKPCLKCPYRERCNGLQMDPVRLQGVPESYGKIL
jgi:MoaA/NifB/PqqE/SkfB family radical SAM enzyme